MPAAAIRPALTDNDLLQIEALAHEIIPDFYASMLPMEHNRAFAARFHSLAALQEQATQGARHYLLYWDGHAQGYACLLPQQRSLILDKCYVRQAFRGRGMGQLVMQEALRLAAEKQLPCISLWVNKANQRAIKWYQEAGFRITQECHHRFASGLVVHDLRMDRYDALTGEEPMHFRHAVAADAPLLQHWDSQPHVQAADPDSDWQWEYELPRNLPWREILLAIYRGEPIGMVQIIDPALEESHYWGDAEPNLRALDIWIGEARNLGLGLGTAMMILALDRCFANPDVKAVLVDPLASNARAHRFYERLGFSWQEDRQFEGHPCRVYRRERGIPIVHVDR